MVAVLLFVAAACGRESGADEVDYEHVLPFDTATMRMTSAQDTARITVLLAESGEQHTLGLMERRSLAPNAGMLFLYPATQPATAAYWMFRTRIPLDIAFVDSTGLIRSILTMQPCTSELAMGCPTYPPGAPYRAALEMNAGFFARTGARVGDRVVLGDTLSRRRAVGGR
jgi:hypothetical protein